MRDDSETKEKIVHSRGNGIISDVWTTYPILFLLYFLLIERGWGGRGGNGDVNVVNLYLFECSLVYNLDSFSMTAFVNSEVEAEPPMSLVVALPSAITS